MRILVTGGAAFVGSYLCDRLLMEGHEVICVDSLISRRKENIAHLLDQRRLTFVLQDAPAKLPEASFPPKRRTASC